MGVLMGVAELGVGFVGMNGFAKSIFRCAQGSSLIASLSISDHVDLKAL